MGVLLDNLGHVTKLKTCLVMELDLSGGAPDRTCPMRTRLVR
jgi:hypothetical protein